MKVAVIWEQKLTYFLNMLKKNLNLPSIGFSEFNELGKREYDYDVLIYVCPHLKHPFDYMEPILKEKGIKLITVWTGQHPDIPAMKVDIDQIKRMTWKHVVMSDVNKYELKGWWGIDAEVRLMPLDWTKFCPDTPVPTESMVAWYCMLQDQYERDRMLSILGRAQVPCYHYGDARLGTFVPDTRTIYRKSSHFLYLVNHSAWSAGIGEMNLMGRTSITNYPHPCVGIYTNDDDEIIEVLKTNYQVDMVEKTRDYLRKEKKWQTLWDPEFVGEELKWEDEV